MTLEEANRRAAENIGERELLRQVYVEFMCCSMAAITATDMKITFDKKRDLISWNMIDDITRRTNKLESQYRKDMDQELLYRYCDLMANFEDMVESRAEKLRKLCNSDVLYASMWLKLMVDAINDNIRAFQGGRDDVKVSLVHKHKKDITNTIDTRWYDLFKRNGLLKTSASIIRSPEYQSMRDVLRSNWHMERVFHKRMKS